MVEAMVNQAEQAGGLSTRVGIEALIETALGMANVEAIAQFGGRLEALHFGVADYAASMRARTVNIGGLNPDYPGDQWHASITRMVIACRAYGLRAIDGPLAISPIVRAMSPGRAVLRPWDGGKWAIHPSQIEMANDVFSPPGSEIEKAERIIEELKTAEAAGKGAASLDGKMIDAASEKMARNLIRHSQGHRCQDNRRRLTLRLGGRLMDIHEYQAKESLRTLAYLWPRGGLASRRTGGLSVA